MALRKLKLLTVPEMRSKAAYRAVEKLLDQVVDSDARLWSVARVMSAQEFEQATEERSLGGMCGNPLCRQPVEPAHQQGRYHIDSEEQKVYELEDGPRFCSHACATATKTFEARLGSDAQALRRFERLWDQMQERKAAAAQRERQAASPSGGGGADLGIAAAAPATPANEEAGVGSVSAAAKPKGVLKKGKAEFAAGSSTTPIMFADVKERVPEAGSGAQESNSAGVSAVRRAQAVEGYLPRAKSNFKVAASAAGGAAAGSGRRVRFDDDGAGAAPAVKLAAPIAVSQPVSEALATQSETDEAGADAPLAPLPANPVIVFDVEDAEGPLEGGSQGLAARFGRLRVADASEVAVALPPSEPSSSDALPMTSTAPEALPPAPAPAIDEILAERLRQGAARLFPALAATLPPELAAQLDAEDSASEAASSDAEGEGWDLDATTDEDEAGPRTPQMSFFGQFYTHMDAWVTQATFDLVASGPGAPMPAPSGGAVPEIVTALSHLLRASLPALLTALAAGGARVPAERALDEMLRTLRLVGALPAFRAVQWQLVALVLLKALSLERAPALRPAFETREGVVRVGKVLAAAAFTIEEFYAVLELLVPPELAT